MMNTALNSSVVWLSTIKELKNKEILQIRVIFFFIPRALNQQDPPKNDDLMNVFISLFSLAIFFVICLQD